MTLQPGDQVRLKSGGPTMTVRTVAAPSFRCSCTWFVSNKLQKEAFLFDMLEKIEDAPAKSP